MAFTGKVQNMRRAAEICYREKLYESAANRYYYCLFAIAKGTLLRENFNYKDFLKASANIKDQFRKHRPFSHATIHIALAECMSYNVEDFKGEWNKVYSLRLTADYDAKPITQEEASECRKIFYEILRRMDNGQFN